MSNPTELHPDYDRLCGIQRDRNVPEYGAVVVPVIWLWDSPYKTKVLAVAEHDQIVKILERHFREDEERLYYRVEPQVGMFVGRLRRLRGWLKRVKPSGWVSAPFLKNAGYRA